MEPTTQILGPSSPEAEAIKGLLASRLALVKLRNVLMENPAWRRFDEFWDKYTTEIKEIDKVRRDWFMSNRDGRSPHWEEVQIGDKLLVPKVTPQNAYTPGKKVEKSERAEPTEKKEKKDAAPRKPRKQDLED